MLCFHGKAFVVCFVAVSCIFTSSVVAFHGNSGYGNALKCYVRGKLPTLLKMLIFYRNPNFINAVADCAFYIGIWYSIIKFVCQCAICE